MSARVRVILAVAAPGAPAWITLQAQGPARPLAHRLERVADGVYTALPDGTSTS